MRNKKKKLLFDAGMILLMTAMLLTVNYFNGAKLYMEFGLIPLLIFYHLGAFSVMKFGKGYGFPEKEEE